MEIDRELRETFIEEYKADFETQLKSKGSIRTFYEGICIGIEFVLTKLGVLDSMEIARIQTEVKERLEKREEANSV